MARPLHHEEPDAIYHVTIHSVAEATIVRDDRDRQELVRAIHRTVKRFGWRCLAVSVLDTHYHMLVTTPDANLAAGMQYLNGTYAQGFNRRHGRRGHLFRERYRRKRVKTEAHLLLTVRYIARNRVEAGVVRHPRVDAWSSYPGVIGNARCWPFIARGQLLGYFGRPERAEESLVAFVEAQLVEATAAS
jgi:putative transposase